MQNDKNYLTRENIGLVEKVRTLEDKLEKVETDLTEAKRKNSEYLEQLLNQKDQFNGNFERKINKELNRLKENHKVELEATK